MAMKRAREAEATGFVKPSKRPKVDMNLAMIWEKLAAESEDIRLEAAFELLQNHLSTDDPENARNIAKRLFRGLCSSRKGARLGFYLALVGTLSMKTGPFGTHELPISAIVSILEAQTAPESGSRGQDERDHYYGRMLGCKAILDSEVLLNAQKDISGEWVRVFSILCALMAEKPWLRPECSSTLISTMQDIAKSTKPGHSDAVKAVSRLFDQLKEHKLLRTIDGVGIWLTAQDSIPKIKLPQGIWTQENPLSAKDVQTVKRVLLDSKSKDEIEDEVLGNSGWSPRLHAAWSLILHRLQTSTLKNRLSFQQFWQEIVDNGLFSPSSTPERKHTGFLVFETALKQVGEQNLEICLSKNLVTTLIQKLRTAQDAYLSRSVRSVLSAVQTLATSRDPSWGHKVILGLLGASDLIDFDTVTRTKTVHSLFESAGIEQGQMTNLLLSWVRKVPLETEDSSKIALKRKNLLNILQRAVCQAIHRIANEVKADVDSRDKQWTLILDTTKQILDLKQDADSENLEQPFDGATSEFLKEKITIIMEAILATGDAGQQIFMQAVSSLSTRRFEAEQTITDTVKTSWTILNNLLPKAQKAGTVQMNSFGDGDKAHARTKMEPDQGLALLFGVLLYEVYDGDVESTEILEDAIAMSKDMSEGSGATKAADQVIEIVLSFASRPSKFFRRTSSLIFEAFSSHMSLDGLQSLCSILSAKESRVGQQELFENGEGDLGEESDSNEEEDGSDLEELDSDVEVVDAGDDENGNQEDSEPDTASSAGSEAESDAEEGVDDEGLMDLESALAKALGTRKLTQDDVADAHSGSGDASDSDEDMSDSDMIELDEKLAEVFRNQQSQTSAQRVRKEEMKSAKENVVNLKNRAMDLVDLFFRLQQMRGVECAQLLVSLLEMARTTGTQQLANRGIEIMKAFVQRCRGGKLPKVEHDAETRAKLKTNLTELHAGLLEPDVSNAVVEAAGQVNVLLCRLLVEAAQTDVVTFVNEASEQRRLEKDGKRKVYVEFWSRFDAWASTAGQKQKEVRGKAQVNGTKKTGQTGKSQTSGTDPGKKKAKQTHKKQER